MKGVENKWLFAATFVCGAALAGIYVPTDDGILSAIFVAAGCLLMAFLAYFACSFVIESTQGTATYVWIILIALIVFVIMFHAFGNEYRYLLSQYNN